VLAHLSRRQALLVLDNCEHLVHACAGLAYALLQGCAELRLLTTSRQPLHISGERTWRVASLRAPDPAAQLSLAELMQYPAVALFEKRAVAVQADFVVTPRNAAAVAAICVRLEGLPLAIELASAWVRVLGAEQILERLDNAFRVLVGRSQSAPSRQQTMRAALDWSYGLLDEGERVVLRRLAVFAGGCTLEAAEAVCSGGGVEPEEVLGLLSPIADASLVQVEQRDGRARYRLLEPVRQYARGYLESSAEAHVILRRHSEYFVAFAEPWGKDANLGGPRRRAAIAALGSAEDNLRTSLRWCLEYGQAEIGLRLCIALWMFWAVRGRFTEGRGWLTQTASLPDAQNRPTLRAVALAAAASLARRQGSYVAALGIYQDVLPLLREADDLLALEHALLDLGAVEMNQGRYQTAQEHWQEALALARGSGHKVAEAHALHFMARLARWQEAYSTSRELEEESVAVSRAAGDVSLLGVSLSGLGFVLLRLGDLATGKRLLEQGLKLNRQIGDSYTAAYSLDTLGQLAIAEGDHAQARTFLRESLRIRQDLGHGPGVGESFESIAELAAADAQPKAAVQLAAAAASVREAVAATLSPMKRAMLARWLVPLRRSYGTEAIAKAWQEGREMPEDQILDLALRVVEAPGVSPSHPPGSAGQGGVVLSPREREVAALLAEGLSNRQIAARLVITERTVKAHIEHILDKLGVASRTHVALWAAADHGLSSREAG